MNAANENAEPTKLVRFAGCQSDYLALAMLAQPHSPLLRRVVFVSCEPDNRWPDLPSINLTLRVPPDMLAAWEAAGDGIPAEYMGEQILWSEIIGVCEREGILSRYELYG